MLAGPNGAGKSTLYEQRIRPMVQAPFINADQIQQDELKDPSMAAAYRAAEIAERRRRSHLAAGTSFVSESTFSHESKLQLIADGWPRPGSGWVGEPARGRLPHATSHTTIRSRTGRRGVADTSPGVWPMRQNICTASSAGVRGPALPIMSWWARS